MNLREILGTFSLAVGTVILFKLFMGSWYGQEPVGSFTAPTSQIEQAPLRLEVDFLDQETVLPAQSTSVKTKYADMTFSSHGATITDLTLTRELEHKTQTFQVWNSADVVDREQIPFLVAFDRQTPYYYTLVDAQDGENVHELTYQAKSVQGSIEKKFIVYKDTHQIDLEITVKPFGKGVRPRIVWPSPLLKALEEDAVSANIISSGNKFEQINQEKINYRKGFFTPTLFGSADKYFVFSMIQDGDQFAQRAYYKSIDRSLLSFLEAKEIDQKTTWKLSFYLGPKELDAMAPVDARLEKTLNYGMFSFVAKPLLRLLNFFEGYTNNYGWAIILITLLIKLFMLPFTIRGEKGMKKFQENQRKLQYLEQKYKHDPKALEEARLDHIRKNGTGGLAGGCFPMLLQWPFFMALYSALNNSIELYRAPFVLWIRDLSLPDPYYVLPFLFFLGMIVSSLAQPGKKTVKELAGPLIMALVMGSFMSTMSSGLVLYMVVNVFLHTMQSQVQRAF